MLSTHALLNKTKTMLRQYQMNGNKMVFTNAEDNPILEELISNAIESVKKVRNYPTSWTDEKIEKDLANYEDIIVKLAIYDYNKEGMEFENSHTESGVTRQFSSRAKVMADILPLVDIF